MNDKQTRRLTASEREGVMRVNLIAALALEVEEAMGNRLGMVPGMKRDLRMIGAVASKMLRNLLTTVPQDQWKALERNIKMCHVVIGARRPGQIGTNDYDNYGVFVSFSDLARLIGACKDHCMMCDFDRQRERSCELRRALDAIGSDVSHEGGCGYRSVVG